MDFALTYTKEQEEFRKEVHAWMEANAKMPKALGKLPLHAMDTTREQWEWNKEFTRKFGAKGWLYPMISKEFGGGGLTFDHSIIIQEELAKYDDVSITSGAGTVSIPALTIYGTEEQKERFLKPMHRGETVTWQLWTEPDSGVDLASIKLRAAKDGDDFIFNGTKNYISGIFEPHYLNTLAVTDPDAPRHRNLGQFYIPATLPGISWQFQDLINKGGQHFVFFDNVRVSREFLVGGETDGWRVTQSSLELEHGGAGSLFAREPLVDELVAVLREGKVRPMAQGVDADEHLVNAIIRTNISRLFNRRNFWMHNTRVPQTFHGSQSQNYGREMRIRNAEDLLELLGPHALTTDEKWGMVGGKVEGAVRGASMATHGGGSYEVDKVIISRRIGLSRTRETAAPTH